MDSFFTATPTLPRRMCLALFGALVWTAAPAKAQMFFAPFSYSYSDERPYQAQRGPYANTRSVAAVLAQEGFRLVGPIDWRGDRVIARGFNPRRGEMRFVIDAYDGDILSERRIGPPVYARGYDSPAVEQDWSEPRANASREQTIPDAPRRPRPLAARPDARPAKPAPQAAVRPQTTIQPPPSASVAPAPAVAAPHPSAPPAPVAQSTPPAGPSHRALVPPVPAPNPAAGPAASAAPPPAAKAPAASNPTPAQTISVARPSSAAPFQPAAPVSPIIGAR